MRPSRLCSSILALAVGLVSSSLFAAVPPPPPAPTPAPAPAPAPLEASGKQPDPVDAGPAPTLTTPPLPPAQQVKPPVLEVPAVAPPPPPPPRKIPKIEEEEPEPEGYAQGDHFEFTMGFLAGQRSYSKTSFKFEEGTAEGIGGGGLVAPFVKAPFDNATVLGLRYDLRLVMSFIRMTVGFDVPFPTYKVSDSTGIYDVSGTMRQVTVQSLSAKELRFGIGGEYPFKKVAIFADLIGGVHWVDTELAIDGYKANYGATNFAFSGRAGLRGYVRKWFFASASGEIGIIGDLRWNAEVSVGFSIK
jgi:hypothetical protein